MLSIEFTPQNQKELQVYNQINNKLLTSSKELKTDTGFITSYYAILPFFKNVESAFMYINILHFKKYNAFKYKSYKEFKKMRFK